MNNVVFTQEDLDKLNNSFEVPMKFGRYKFQEGYDWYMKGKPDKTNWEKSYYYGKTKKALLEYYNLCQQN